jgi:hypothetical protein
MRAVELVLAPKFPKTQINIREGINMKKIFLLSILVLFVFCNSYAGVRFISGSINVSGTESSANPTDQFSANPVFSVGTTATELDNEGTITVASNIATFSVAFPTNVGVGDTVQYDVNNNAAIDSGEWGIIHGISTNREKAYLLKTDGTGVTNTTAPTAVYDIFRSYISLSNWENQTENTNLDDDVEGEIGLTDLDLTDVDDEDGPLYVACYADGNDSTAMTIDGYTTDADDYIEIFTPYLTTMVGTRQRHLGIWSTSYYYMQPSDATAITVSDDYVRVYGLQFAHNSLSIDRALVYTASISSGHMIFGYNIFNGNSDVHANGLYLNDNSATYLAYNNIVQDCDNGPGIYANGAAGSLFYNNTVVNGTTGISSNGTSNTATNNLCGGNGIDFSGTFNGSSDYNAASDTTNTGGGNDQTEQSFTFVGGGDYHLQSGDSGAKDLGYDLSGTFTDDIDNQTRSGSWDIGADEYQ